MAKLEEALSRWKAGGLSGIFPELVLCSGPVLLERLLVLMQTVWKGGCVFKDWRDALIVPVPNNGGLQSLEISLLDVVGKIFARDCLEVIAEGLLPKSQCSF